MAEEVEEEKSSRGNTGLPFGLCEKFGISLPRGATPRMAWDALKGKTGYSPEQFYEILRGGFPKLGSPPKIDTDEVYLGISKQTEKKIKETCNRREQ